MVLTRGSRWSARRWPAARTPPARRGTAFPHGAVPARPGAACKARAKLPERFLRRLVFAVGRRLEDEAPAAWRWKGRRALLVDGTTLLLADTPANRAAYPQMASQEPGLGFPIVRLVVLLGLAS